MCNVQSAVCSVQVAGCSVQFAVCRVMCAVCSVQSAVRTMKCAVCSVQSAVSNVHSYQCSVKCEICGWEHSNVNITSHQGPGLVVNGRNCTMNKIYTRLHLHTQPNLQHTEIFTMPDVLHIAHPKLDNSGIFTGFYSIFHLFLFISCHLIALFW